MKPNALTKKTTTCRMRVASIPAARREWNITQNVLSRYQHTFVLNTMCA